MPSERSQPVINFHEVKFMKILLLPLVMGGIGKGRCLIGRPPTSSGKQAFWLFSFFSRVFVPPATGKNRNGADVGPSPRNQHHTLLVGSIPYLG